MVNTKLIPSFAAKTFLKQHRKVTKHLEDRLSHDLVQCWWGKHHKGRSPEDYFFPCMGKSQVNWSKPMTNMQHNLAIQACAAHCALPATSEFTSTAIRRGNALTTEVEVAKFRSQRNLANAWSHKSTVALSHYCPATVMVQPGPLFTNSIHMEKKYHAFFVHSLLKQYRRLPQCCLRVD